RIAEEEARRRLESMARRTTLRTVEKRSYIVNFVPFGAGQFQQDRTRWGVLFAITEGVMALTSVISYWALEGLIQTRTINLTDTQEPVGPIVVKGTRPEDQAQVHAWDTI